MRRLVPLLALTLACGPTVPNPEDSDGDDETGPASDSGSDATDGALAPLAMPGPSTEGRWTTVETCQDCHTTGTSSDALQDAVGRDVSPVSLWPATMMANAARDPIWRAVVEAEVAARPAVAAAIEGTCQRCHAPMKSRLDAQDGIASRVDDLWSGPRARLGLDGVGCTVCHQISPEGLGTDAVYTGAFALSPQGVLYGPHASPFARPMEGQSGYTPTQGAHMTQGALCSSCHTLITETLTEDGEATGNAFHEQTTYLEWRASAFSTEGTPGPEAADCQTCHAPTFDDDGKPITTRIARRPDGGDFPPVSPRSPLGRHVFVGANTLALGLLRDHADELSPRATTEAFNAQIDRTRAFLAASVHLAFGTASRDGDRVELPVSITHDAGHRFPTGFPSRRVWLAITVRDAAGVVVFRSGAWDDKGRWIDEAGTVLSTENAGGPIAGHVDVVDADDVVASWEQVMADAQGDPTFRLLTAAEPHRDDRLLPRGWDEDRVDAGRAPPTGVGGDRDFVPGGDTVRVRFVVAGHTGPFQVDAQVAYQALSPRWRAELAATGGPAARRLDAWLDEAPPLPEIIAEAMTEIP